MRIFFYGLFFCSSDYAHYVLLISGYDGYLIPQLMSPFLTMFSYDFELWTSLCAQNYFATFSLDILLLVYKNLDLPYMFVTLDLASYRSRTFSYNFRTLPYILRNQIRSI